MAKCAVFMAFLVVVIAVSYMIWPQDNNYDGNISAVLVSASLYGYADYALQADICHAFQVLRNGRVNEQKVVVMMGEDFANHPKNLHPGMIIHEPGGPNVYHGVNKDYVGASASLSNLVAVLTGNKNMLNGGSGRVLSANPNGRVFLFISTHGDEGSLYIGEEVLTKQHLFQILSQSYISGMYQSMVLYVSACHSGSMFSDYDTRYKKINVHIVTSCLPNELTRKVAKPEGYNTNLASQFGIAWTKDSDKYNRTKRTLQDQYNKVKLAFASLLRSSTPTQYGHRNISRQTLDLYHGYDANGPA